MGASPKAAAAAADDEAVTPLPMIQLVSCMLVMMTVSFQINVIWPFLPFMVDHIRMVDGVVQDNAGFWVGMLASSYFITQTLAAFVWGVLPGKFGLKRCMIFSSVGVGISLIGFGMSESFWLAFFWRAVGGAANGNAPLVKSYLAKITDKSNQAKGFSTISFSWGIGGLIAPTLGGFLSEPLLKYPGLELDPLGPFGIWPYFLPCLTAAIVCFIAAGSVMVWIPDDHKPEAQYTRVQATDSAASADDVGGDDDEEDSGADAEERQSLTAGSSGKGDPSDAEESGSVYSGASTEKGGHLYVPSYREILQPQLSGLACMAYLYSSLNFVIFDEMLPLYCKADYAHGGLAWDTTAIGTALSIGGLVLCFYQPLVYPVITKRLGIVGTYTAGAFTFTFATSLFSFITYLTPYGPTAVWTAMIIFRALYVHSATCMFAGSGILINNSCEMHYVSKANAIGQAIASFARAVFPTVAGGIWAYCQDLGFPWQPHSVYFLLFVLNVGAVWNALKLPVELNTPKAQLQELKP